MDVCSVLEVKYSNYLVGFFVKRQSNDQTVEKRKDNSVAYTVIFMFQFTTVLLLH